MMTERILPPKANAKRIPRHRPVIRLGILISVVFAGLLGALLTYGVKDRLGRRHAIAASKYAAEAERALMEYFVDHQSFPEGDNTAITVTLTGENDARRDYFAGKSRDIFEYVMRDSYGHPLRIRFTGNRAIVDSAGPDGAFETPDDVDSAPYRALSPYPPLPEPNRTQEEEEEEAP